MVVASWSHVWLCMLHSEMVGIKNEMTGIEIQAKTIEKEKPISIDTMNSMVRELIELSKRIDKLSQIADKIKDLELSEEEEFSVEVLWKLATGTASS